MIFTVFPTGLAALYNFPCLLRALNVNFTTKMDGTFS